MPNSSGKSKKSTKSRQKEEVAEKAAKYAAALETAISEYENERPTWMLDAIAWLAELALNNLRTAVDGKKQRYISWDSPYIDCLYPVDLDWKKWKEDSQIVLRTIKFSRKNIATTSAARKTLSQGMVRHLTVLALNELTGWVAFEKKDDAYIPILKEDQIDELKRLKTQRKRDLYLKVKFHPFAMGAGVFETNDEATENGVPFTKSENEEFAVLLKLIQPPLLSGNLDINGNKLEFRIIFQAHPLVIDSWKRKAFFKITAGIFLQPCDPCWNPTEPTPLWASPASWKTEDRKQFWTYLFASLRNLNPPSKKEISEAVITVHAKLKIPFQQSDLEATKLASEKILKSFHQAGTVLDFGYAVTAAASVIDDATKANLKRLEANVIQARTANEKGETLEALVKALFETVPGFHVRTRIHTVTEEIDISIINRSTDPLFAKEGAVILAECKNWSGCCGKNELVLFKAKIANRKHRANLGFLISWNGFAQTLTKEMLRTSNEEAMVVPLDGNQIRKAIAQGSFLEVLQQAWDETIHL